MTEGRFSAAVRPELWAELGDGVYDLLVIGGGITGTGVARDAAGRGLRVAVVDAGDWGAATSSRSSRLVHGGLRYLETLDFALVFEALRERRRLLELAPHLVRPLPFLFPVYRGDPTGFLKLGAGMWLYDTLSLFRSPRRHRMLRRGKLLKQEPGLRGEGLAGGALYYDAQVDDARLTVALARAAAEAGAVTVSHARVAELHFDDGGGRVVVEDALGVARAEVAARLVVNAAGPWSDVVRGMADPSVTPRLRTTKGVHILVSRERVGNRHAIIFRSPVDGRIMFVLPWGAYAYVGTTDTEFAGDPSDAGATAEDIRYLLDSANGIFPRAMLTTADVLSTWTGVRPLLAPVGEKKLSASATSREHAIWRDPGGLLNVAGGKLTTYRSMAAETVDRAATILQDEHGIPSDRYFTEFIPLPGAPEGSMEELTERVREAGRRLEIEPAIASHLVERYGDDTLRILSFIEEDPTLAAPLLPPHPYIAAEILFAVRFEMAITLEDVLRRRLHLFYEARDGGLAVAEEIARRMASMEGVGWSEAEIQEQVGHYAAAMRETRPPDRS